jgi:hypothetical protein
MRKTGIIGNTECGFFSCFRTTVSTIQYCELKGILPYVDWRTSLYNDSPEENAWEYYFKQVSDATEEEVQNAERAPLKYMNRSAQARDAYIEMIKKYVQVNIGIHREVAQFTWDNWRKKMVGVHYRATDKMLAGVEGLEPAEGMPVSIDKYKEHIDDYMDHETGIFLATDCAKALEHFKQEYGDLVVTIPAIRATDGKAVHRFHKGNNRQKGEEVLKDMLLLSRCDHMIKGSSSIAVCSMLFNPQLTCDNLNYKYNNDTRELWAEKP